MKRQSRRARQAALKKEKQKRYFMIGIAVIGVLLLVTAMAISLSSRPSVDPTDADAVALGKEVYDLHCASCHGANLEGEADWQQPNPDGTLRAPAHDETGHTWHHNDLSLIQAIQEGGARLPASSGVSAMPAYKDALSDREVAAVLAYIKSTWPPNILATQQQR